jgi:hypothetical protein
MKGAAIMRSLYGILWLRQQYPEYTRDLNGIGAQHVRNPLAFSGELVLLSPQRTASYTLQRLSGAQTLSTATLASEK